MTPMRAVLMGVALATAAAASPLAATAAYAAGPDPAVAPVVTSVSPADGPAAGGTSVTIDGTGFTGATAVLFNSVAATGVTVVSDTAVTATSPAGTSGTVDIVVIAPGGRSATSSADQFGYGPPTITGVSPSTGYEPGGTKITITGTGFDPILRNDDVEVGDEVRADVVSATTTKLVVYSPPSDHTGSDDVTVQVKGNTGPASNSEPFTYLATVAIIAIEGANKALYVSSGGGRFVNYGGALKGGPSVVSSNDRNYYFVRGADDNLYVRDDKSAYTKLRPSAPLDCATPPAATTEGDGLFTVACVGTNGTLYTAAGALPAKGNPLITALHSAPGTYGSDLTATKGGVGTTDLDVLTVIGKGYGASGPVTGANANAYAAGNTYLVELDDETGQVEPSGILRVGGSCAGAPQFVFGGGTDDVFCRSTSSAATLVYRVTYDTSGNNESETTTVSNLGGAAIGSPAVSTDGSGDEVLVSGTNGRLYEALVKAASATAFRGLPIASVAASGPAINAGPPPAATAMARRSFLAQHVFAGRH